MSQHLAAHRAFVQALRTIDGGDEDDGEEFSLSRVDGTLPAAALEASADEMLACEPWRLRLPLSVCWLGEDGLGAGPAREWFSACSEHLLLGPVPAAGTMLESIFKPSADRGCYVGRWWHVPWRAPGAGGPKESSVVAHGNALLRRARAAGRLLGMSLAYGWPVGVRLSPGVVLFLLRGPAWLSASEVDLDQPARPEGSPSRERADYAPLARQVATLLVDAGVDAGLAAGVAACAVPLLPVSGSLSTLERPAAAPSVASAMDGSVFSVPVEAAEASRRVSADKSGAGCPATGARADEARLPGVDREDAALMSQRDADAALAPCSDTGSAAASSCRSGDGSASATCVGSRAAAAAATAGPAGAATVAGEKSLALLALLRGSTALLFGSPLQGRLWPACSGGENSLWRWDTSSGTAEPAGGTSLPSEAALGGAAAPAPALPLGVGRISCRAGLLSTVRAGLLEVAPQACLDLLAADVAGAVWAGDEPTAASLREHCRASGGGGRLEEAAAAAAEGALRGRAAEAEEVASVAGGAARSTTGAGASSDRGCSAAAEEAFWEAVTALEADRTPPSRRSGSACGSAGEGAGSYRRGADGGMAPEGGWLRGLLRLWTGASCLPVGDTSIGEDDAGSDTESDAGAANAVLPSQDTDPETPWLALRLVSVPAEIARALPTAQTCERVLSMQIGLGEAAGSISSRLRVAISHGAAGFAFE